MHRAEWLHGKEAAMDPSKIEPLLREQLQVRVGPEMAAYVARRLAAAQQGQAAPFEIIGGDARTGVPVRRQVDPQALLGRIQA